MSIVFDQRYIYKDGKKSQSKRIHNFYSSKLYTTLYNKNINLKNNMNKMRNTIDFSELIKYN